MKTPPAPSKPTPPATKPVRSVDVREQRRAYWREQEHDGEERHNAFFSNRPKTP